MPVQNAPSRRCVNAAALFAGVHSVSRHLPLATITVILVNVLCAAPVAAADFSLKFEPGVAIPLTAPQTDHFDVGGAAALKGLIGLCAYLDATVGVAFLGLPAVVAGADPGTAWAGTLGLRVKPRRLSFEERTAPGHSIEHFGGIQPWLDADLQYVATGPLQRFGVAAAVGVAMPLGAERAFWLGPFVRYAQIVQGERPGFNNGDAMTLIVGISLEAGTALVPLTHAEVPVARSNCLACAEPVPCPEGPTPIVVYDGDGDSVPDETDRCPDMPGPVANGGCPVYANLIVSAGKFELKEKIQFVPNRPDIEKISHPTLYEVAAALNEHKGIRVEVEGHASSEGEAEHNQTLSEQRAQHVLDFLVEHGVARDRLISKGFSASRPLATNKTEAGRETNRRVEFVIIFNIVKGNAQ